MHSTILRKSITDLTRRKARASFTVLTLALAVASIGVFAVPAVMQQAMDREVAANRLADVTLTMKPLRLTARELAALQRLPNVAAVEPRTTFATRVYVGSRRDEAMLIGVPDFGAQQADVVAVAKGAPRAGSLLVEEASVRSGDFKGSAREDRHRRRVGARAADQRPGPHPGRILRVGLPTFYAPARDRRGDRRRPTAIRRSGFAAERRRAARAAERTVAAVRDQLRATTGFTAFGDLPDHPRAGQLSRQGGLRVDGEHPQRRHAARADLRARAALEHDDDAGRRADRRDRRHEGDRRPPARHPAHLPAHRGHVRRPGLGPRRRAGDRDLEPRGRATSRSCSSASTPPFGISVPVVAREPGRRARRPAARGAAGRAARRAPAAQRGAAGLRVGGRRPGSRSMRCCGARTGCRGRSRSACAASGAASAAPPRRCCRSASRSRPAWRCSRSAPAWRSPRAGGSTTTTSTSGSSRRPARCSTPAPARAITGVDGVDGAQPWLSNAVKVGDR